MNRDDVALFRRVPALARAVPWVRLGAWPTPVEPLPAIGRDVWVKREDRSSPIYGGNKVRTLEAVLGRAQAAGARTIWATGAYGSNHAVATVMHAERAGMDAGVIMFPQPASEAARANLGAMIARGAALVRIANVAMLPFAMRRVRRDDAWVMPPGGATPEGAMGALSAAFELATQIEDRIVPAPSRIVLAVGSTCTTAGLLAGVHLAASLGIGFDRARLPAISAVRVTPWPVTDPWRVASLAAKTLALADELRGDRTGVGLRGLRASLTVEGAYFGGGYGRATARGLRAAARFAEHGGPPLDAVYSAKAGAALLDLAPRTDGPVLFWATKSSATLPSPSEAQLAQVDPVLRTWLSTKR
ncbi:MAG TPA: pyridoxal-phosphate dependent enzyme [Kofleriaceae bacterium]|nr:pyridoxal-phosphate dependent enzyme [Kofleriaceae bacterium]